MFGTIRYWWSIVCLNPANAWFIVWGFWQRGVIAVTHNKTISLLSSVRRVFHVWLDAENKLANANNKGNSNKKRKASDSD